MNTEELAIGTPNIEIDKKESILKTIIDLFHTPSSAFKSLAVKPKWFIPFVLCALTSIVFMVVINDIRLEDTKRAVQANQSLSPEEIDRRVENLTMQQQGDLTNMHIPSFLMGIGFITIGYTVQLFGLSLIIWLALQLYMSKISFKAILGLCSFSFLVLIPEAAINIPLMLMKGTMKIYLGMAVILPRAWESSPLFNLCEKLDVFSIWMAVILMIGIPIVTGISKKKAIFTVSYLWVVWLLFSMFFGDFIQIV